ncbi:hypothetical protein V8G69_02700 [Gaetbulibacter sp. M235]|uniref:hypothetical protein n=1 Tax=Gaetbulibacter sp. M235 TaxID=3126510 RepID=UPI00374EA0AE
MEHSVDTSRRKLKEDVHGSVEDKNTFSFYTEILHAPTLKMRTIPSRYQWTFGHLKEAVLTEPNTKEFITLESEGEITSVIPEKVKSLNFEDSDNFINNIFSGRDFISSETWASNEIIKSRIISSDDDYVYLDCILDIETMHFEQRQFHKSLFSNFKTLQTGGLVLIKLKSKPGSFRVDVYPGEGLVNPELFDFNEEIKELRGRDLGAKLQEW